MTKHMVPAQVRGIVSVRAEAPQDVKALIDAVNQDWKEFKSAVEQQNRDIKARFEDVVTNEKLDRINTSLGDMQSQIDQAHAKMAAIVAGAGGSDGVLKDAEYSEAFRAHFQRGDVQAALNKGNDGEGGYLAPVEWDRTITDRLIEVSPMRQISGQMTISNAGFTKLYNLRGTSSGWVPESGARPSTDNATFASLAFRPGELYAEPIATQQMLDDAEINLESWLAGEVETEFAYQEGLAFIAGDGANKPHGFLSYATGSANASRHPLGPIEVHAAASAVAISADEIIDLIHLLPSAYTQNARFVMNRSTQGAIRKLKDGDGNFLWQPSFAAGQPPTLSGYPTTEMPGMPDIATGAIPIGFGDFQRGYLIVDRTGVRILRDPYTSKPNVKFYTTKRVGGGVSNPETLKVIRMA